MYALNLDKNTGRILSACVVLPNDNYDSMPLVDSLPEGNITEFCYINGEFVYKPLPKLEVVEIPTTEDRLSALEAAMLEMILGGAEI